jgi:hypothetical protein
VRSRIGARPCGIINASEWERRMAVTNEDLQAARLAVERTRAPYDEALKARRALVKRALKEGMRPAVAARHAGISRTAAGKLR